MTYTDSVLAQADEYGLLEDCVLQQLLTDHDLLDTVADVRTELGDVYNEAETFLTWLGY